MEFFTTLSFVALSLGIWIVVSHARMILEFFLPSLAKKPVWLNLILPFLPVLLGGLFGVYVVDYPYATELAASNMGRFFYGLVAGFLSSFTYRIVKAFVNSKISNNDTSTIQANNNATEQLESHDA